METYIANAEGNTHRALILILADLQRYAKREKLDFGAALDISQEAFEVFSTMEALDDAIKSKGGS